MATTMEACAYKSLHLIVFMLLTGRLASEDLYFDWNVEYAQVTRLCGTKSIVTVNGQFPGPTIYVTEGDNVTVNVTNSVSYNITIHWHGIRQLQSAWADGPAYITQCPIQTGNTYVYKFKVINQRGTLFWHAHISWLRATVYGAFIIKPNSTLIIPHDPDVVEQKPIMLGEWWISDIEKMVEDELLTGSGFNTSDARTINGQPGHLYECSSEGMSVFNVVEGETYMLRVINAAMETHLYFGVANHSFTVVEVDGDYTEPLQTDIIVLSPGQTTAVLMTANGSVGDYLMAASIFHPVNTSVLAFPSTPPTTALLHYEAVSSDVGAAAAGLDLPEFPAFDDVEFVADFMESLRSPAFSNGYLSYEVPLQIDEDLYYTLAFALQPLQNSTETTLSAAINNITFARPYTALLEAYYEQTGGVYTTDFPDKPANAYDYTGADAADVSISVRGTRVKVLNYNASVQIVFQNAAPVAFQSHPMHLHGTNFYIVGSGFGNYDATLHAQNFNLANPPSRNTVAVPSGGWAAIRFRATNPGVWFMHCHLEAHTSWGMSMAFIIKDGSEADTILPSPPEDLPRCYSSESR